MPICSITCFLRFDENVCDNENFRVDFVSKNTKDNSLKIILNDKSTKPDKKNNVTILENKINYQWFKYNIKAHITKGCELQIYLRGPYKKNEDPVHVDYRGVKVNGKLLFDKQQVHCHNDPILYKIQVNDNEVVDISFEARKHHFRLSDVTKVYKVNLWILCGTVLLSFFISWKLVSYIAKFKKRENISAVDIVFVCVFFGLLFIPMSNINTAEKSEQENRMLAKKPKLINDTGVGYNTEYGKDTEKWFNDRFLGRTLAIKLDTALKFIVNRVYKKGGALLFSDDNWMFVDRRLCTPSEREMLRVKNELHNLDKFCKQNHIKLYVLMVPFKNAVYHEILERNCTYNVMDDSRYAYYIAQLRTKTGIPIIYPYEELRTASREDFVFFKQAHHWTDWGAYQGYLALMKEISRDFPDIKTVTLDEYKKSTAKKIRDGYSRDYNTGHITRLLGFNPDFAEKHLLLDDYIYYDNKCGDDLMAKKSEKYTKSFKQKGGKYKIFLTGNSQNENLLQFLPYSAHKLKFIRLNRGQLQKNEQWKFLKHYKKEVIDFKPDILIYCISSESAASSLSYLTKD